MKRYLLYILLSIVLFAGCTRGQWLDEIVAQRDKQAEVVPILLDAYDKGLLVTSVEEIECTDKYLWHSEYSRCYRWTLSNDTVVEIQDVDTWHNFEKRGQAYVSEILMGYQVVEIDIWLPDEEWKQAHEDLVSEDGASVRFSLPIRESGNDSGEDNTTSIPDNEIWYTSTDGEIVIPSGGFNTNIVSNTYENGQGVITFSSTLTTIGKNAFLNCDRLKSVILPNTITSIEFGAFHYCYSLESVNIPNGITTIEMDTFSECISLQSIRIPDSVTVIGDWAFHLCTSLTEVTIPAGVTTIGGCAFDENPNLSRVYCKPTTPPQIDSSTFYGSGYFTLYVPENSVSAYKAATYWKDLSSAIVGYDFESDKNHEGGVISIDGDFSDWDALGDGRVSMVNCADGAQYSALKTIKAHADGQYNLYVYMEFDEEQIYHHSTQFNVFIDNDLMEETGGYSYVDWMWSGFDYLIQGFIKSDGSFVSYDPGAYPWNGEIGAGGWNWRVEGYDVIPEGSGFGEGWGFHNTYEFRLNLATLNEFVPIDNTCFAIGCAILNMWSNAGVLPNATMTSNNNRGLEEPLWVYIEY